MVYNGSMVRNMTSKEMESGAFGAGFSLGMMAGMILTVITVVIVSCIAG